MKLTSSSLFHCRRQLIGGHSFPRARVLSLHIDEHLCPGTSFAATAFAKEVEGIRLTGQKHFQTLECFSGPVVSSLPHFSFLFLLETKEKCLEDEITWAERRLIPPMWISLPVDSFPQSLAWKRVGK